MSVCAQHGRWWLCGENASINERIKLFPLCISSLFRVTIYQQNKAVLSSFFSNTFAKCIYKAITKVVCFSSQLYTHIARIKLFPLCISSLFRVTIYQQNKGVLSSFIWLKKQTKKTGLAFYIFHIFNPFWKLLAMCVQSCEEKQTTLVIVL